MSQEFRGGATDNLADEYEEKVKYRKFLLETGYEFLDTLYKTSLYGFINRNYEVIAPVPNTSIFGNYSAEAEGVTFVVNQFTAFRDYYLSKADEGNYTVPALITDLKPRVSFENYEINYSIYLESYKASMVEKMLFTNSDLSYEEFVNECQKKIFDIDMLGLPASKSGFMLSNNADVYNTGLYIDLRQSSGRTVDQERADFITDEGFPCFMEIANKFGFYIDGNFPWRLAVNLNHEYTKTLLMNGRPTPMFDNFYSDQYVMKVGLDDYDAVVRLYREMYVVYKELNGIVVLANFSDSVTPESYLKTLLYHRFNELSLMRSHEGNPLFKTILRNTLDRYNLFGLSSNSGAIGYINDFCARQLKNKILGQM